MQELLARWGLTVTAFADAETALRTLDAGSAFDVVISDQTMPGMSGLDFAHAVHARNPRLPVVLYTGRPDALAAEDLARAGVCALLSKPIDPQALLATLRSHMAQATGEVSR